MIRVLVLLFATILVYSVHAQSNETGVKFLDEAIWYPGKVYLVTGEVVEGSLSRDLLLDIIRVRDGDRITNYNPEDILNFELTNNGVQEVFYSLKIKEGDSRSQLEFFKLLENYNDIILLSREYRVVVTSVGPNNNRQPMDSFVETICIGFSENRIEPFLGRNLRVNTMLSTSSRLNLTDKKIQKGREKADARGYKLLNKNLLEEVMGETKYELVKDYIKANKLDKRELEDLKKILAYYSDL